MTESSGGGRPAFDPERIIEALNRHGVRYVAARSKARRASSSRSWRILRAKP
jgi:hypothetical protein